MDEVRAGHGSREVMAWSALCPSCSNGRGIAHAASALPRCAWRPTQRVRHARANVVHMAKTLRGEYGPTAYTKVELPDSLHDVKGLRDIQAKPFDFAALKGKVVLIVNTATEDKFSNEWFSFFNELYDAYGARGFEIIAFPSNWYGQRESGSPQHVEDTMRNEYNVKFKIMWKQIDLVTSQPFNMGFAAFGEPEILWNFETQLLFDHKGLPINRFDLTTPRDEIRRAIEDALKAVKA
ncbi:Glutathione peroxidase 1 [Porphyridium purpureum]|uniref:Glutathione peroxidase n=1 Tax=Porphyridium purpureum TaxID=35688 RepID=A0A5J4YLS5_PORPP|nr:Glutathione peroxidase 1 [Porphyridium purpureum]|eukprot:POR8084..scf244_11